MTTTFPTALPPWPLGLKREWKPLARFTIDPGIQEALRVQEQVHANQCSGTTGTWGEIAYVSQGDGTAVNTTSSEASLLTGLNEQPTIPAFFFFNKQGKYRYIVLDAAGVLSTTTTPTIIFQVRMSTTQGASTLSGASLGVTGAITTQSGVTNKWWKLHLELVCLVTGQGSGNAQLQGSGYVMSPTGFASPFIYPLEPTTPDTATWTQTFDGALTYYLNLSATWGTNSSSNTITCKAPLTLKGWN